MGLQPLPPIERGEVVLVWRDGSTTRATVPIGADECSCGASRFHRSADACAAAGVPVFAEEGGALAVGRP